MECPARWRSGCASLSAPTWSGPTCADEDAAAPVPLLARWGLPVSRPARGGRPLLGRARARRSAGAALLAASVVLGRRAPDHRPDPRRPAPGRDLAERAAPGTGADLLRHRPDCRRGW